MSKYTFVKLEYDNGYKIIDAEYSEDKISQFTAIAEAIKIKDTDKAIALINDLEDYSQVFYMIEKEVGGLLHFAAQNDNQSIAKALLDKGVVFDLQNAHRKTPLHTAIEFGSEEFARYVIDDKSDAELMSVDEHNNTLLHAATASNQVSICRLLIDQCKDLIGAENDDHKMPLDIAQNLQSDELIHILGSD